MLFPSLTNDLWPAAILALAACVPFDANAQAAFSRIEISAGPSVNLENSFSETRLYNYWNPGTGAELTFLAPFYFGEAEAGAALHQYESFTADVPSFDALLVFFGWGYDWEFLRGLSWYNGLRMGNQRMTFDEDTFPGIRNESEFMVAYQTRAAFRFYRNTGIFASAQFTQTYTFIRLRTAYVSFGLTTSISTPGWLQSLLR